MATRHGLDGHDPARLASSCKLSTPWSGTQLNRQYQPKLHGSYVVSLHLTGASSVNAAELLTILNRAA